MRGGFRENAGRKKGFSAIEAEKAREFIVKKVNDSLEPIITSLINKSKQGDIRATQLLFDRAYGRAITPIEADIELSPTISLILDEIENDNKYDDLYKQQKSLYEPQSVNTNSVERFQNPSSVLSAWQSVLIW